MTKVTGGVLMIAGGFAGTSYLFVYMAGEPLRFATSDSAWMLTFGLVAGWVLVLAGVLMVCIGVQDRRDRKLYEDQPR